MKVIKRGNTPDGYNVVIEDWGEGNSYFRYMTVAFTPATESAKNCYLGPRRGETWRWDFRAETIEEAEEMFAKLEAGASPREFADRYRDYDPGRRNDFIECM